jgi:hypothetical protein
MVERFFDFVGGNQLPESGNRGLPGAPGRLYSSQF